MVIETQNISKRFGPFLAVENVSFQVEKGQVFGFLGPNGGGKSTTIGLLLGVITPTSGEVRLFGSKGDPGFPEGLRRRIGATLEYPSFYPHLSGFENLRLIANIKGLSLAEANSALGFAGLAGRGSVPVQQYSMGMKQRLALGAAVLGHPDLIILDEPTNGLDPEGMREIREKILHLNSEGTTIFLSSHLLFEVERICTEVAIIHSGRIVHRSSLKELAESNNTVEVRARDAEALVSAVRSYRETDSLSETAEGVTLTLRDGNISALNRYLVLQGVELHHLARQKGGLEEVFLQITSPAPAADSNERSGS